MKTPPETNEFLADVLRENTASDFRQTALANTLRTVRRRRFARLAGKTIAAVAVLISASVWYWPRSSATLPVITRPAAKTDRLAYALVLTQPLPVSKLVFTQTGSVNYVATSKTAFALLVNTPRDQKVAELSDDQLLTAIRPLSVALVRLPSQRAELVFFDAADESLVQ